MKMETKTGGGVVVGNVAAAQDGLGPQKLEEAGKDPSLESSEEPSPVAPGFLPSGLQNHENIISVVFSKHLGWWHSAVWQPQENKTAFSTCYKQKGFGHPWPSFPATQLK